MADVRVVRGDIRHVIALADTGLREADRREVQRATGKLPIVVLCDAHRRSQYSFSALVDGEPVAMFGAAPQGIMGGSATIWMLGTDDAERHWLSFGKISKEAVAFLRSQYQRLENWVDAENTVSIEWLRWLGFTLDPQPRPYGVAQTPFYHFEWRAE